MSGRSRRHNPRLMNDRTHKVGAIVLLACIAAVAIAVGVAVFAG